MTGIVWEFQFGMNWSSYSRFVGDIFGAPLAVEALLTFFLESTFLGLWIFGWDRLPKKVHLATIWLAAIGTSLSAYMILAANAFMQHPVGYVFNPEKNRAQMTSFSEVLFQNTAVVAWVHTVSAAFLTAGAFMAGISLWLLMRNKSPDMARSTLKLGAIVSVIAAVALSFSGDQDAKIMVQQQPMKMAAAEALYETATPAPFSILTVGSLDGSKPLFTIEVPGALSFLATGSFDGTVQGINNLEQQYQGAVRTRVRTRLLHALHSRHLLGLPPHDRLRHVGRPVRGARPLGVSQGAHPHVEVVARDGDPGAVHAVARQLVRLDLHRDGPPAVVGVRSVPDRLRGVPRSLGGPGADQPDHVHRALRRARRGRGGTHAAGHQTGPPESVRDPFADHDDPDRELTVTY